MLHKRTRYGYKHEYTSFVCDKCNTDVPAFSNDAGELVCPYCELTGLLITDDETCDYLEKAREFAHQIGLSDQLERQLCCLAGNHNLQTFLGRDFAPHSFSFGMRVPPSNGEPGHPYMHGGLIYEGPDCPADGSFPSLTVSLTRSHGWFCHT